MWDARKYHKQLTMKGKFFCGDVNADGLRCPRDAKYGFCPLLFKFTNICNLQMCFQEYTWFFKPAGDGCSEFLILYLLYTFKCSGIKILNPNIPKSLSFYNFMHEIIPRKANTFQTSYISSTGGYIFHNEGIYSKRIVRNLLNSTNGKIIHCMIFWFEGWMEVECLSVLRRREIGFFMHSTKYKGDIILWHSHENTFALWMKDEIRKIYFL